ncbi:hypothetical protein [Streptomyces murinus]|uniref:hypothetical protein n=1 Tax=Streptomyces murinus TaxID=33900 RepID=UPI003F48F226
MELRAGLADQGAVPVPGLEASQHLPHVPSALVQLGALGRRQVRQQNGRILRVRLFPLVQGTGAGGQPPQGQRAERARALVAQRGGEPFEFDHLDHVAAVEQPHSRENGHCPLAH